MSNLPVKYKKGVMLKIRKFFNKIVLFFKLITSVCTLLSSPRTELWAIEDIPDSIMLKPVIVSSRQALTGDSRS